MLRNTQQWIWKENRALTTRLQYARLKQTACLEDIDFRHPRGLKRAVIEHLASCEWIRHHQNCLITGPTGVGKSYIGCSLAHKACRERFRSLYYYVPKLFRELARRQPHPIAEKTGPRRSTRHRRLGTTLKPDQYRLFLEILDDRQGTGATLITSQYPPTTWHELIGDGTVADAILDRLVHNAHQIELKGGSMRKKKTPGGSKSAPDYHPHRKEESREEMLNRHVRCLTQDYHDLMLPRPASLRSDQW